jgi:hypothetical protein
LPQLIDVTWPLKAFAHSHLAALDAHQGKGGRSQMGFYGDSGFRSAARSSHRVNSILRIRLGNVKERDARHILTTSPCGNGHDPAAYAA